MLLFEESVHVCLHVRVEQTTEHVVVVGHLKEPRECNGTRNALSAFAASNRIEEFESFLPGRDRHKWSLCSKKGVELNRVALGKDMYLDIHSNLLASR